MDHGSRDSHPGRQIFCQIGARSRADLRGLPPLYLQVAQFDTMADGALALAANALHAGVEVTLESWPGMIHGWHGLANAGVPEAVAAWAAIRRYVDARVGA